MDAKFATVIANMAISHVRGNEITKLTDQSEEARKCRLFLEPSLEQTLQSLDWGFARRYVRGALLSSTNNQDTIGVDVRPGWSHAFDYPADAVAIRGVAMEFRGERYEHFEIGQRVGGEGTGRVIYTDRPGPYIVYTTRDVDTSQMDPMFISAWSWRLAWLIAYALTSDRKDQDYCDKVFQREIVLAQAMSLNEGLRAPERDHTPDWIEARS